LQKKSFQLNITPVMIHLFSLHLLACLTAGRNNTQDMVPLNNQNQLYEDKMRDKGIYIYIFSQRCPEK